jgi:serine/threonine protein phosphatase 1
MPNRRIAIGDVHGCSHTLKYLSEHKLKVQQGDTLYMLGDYVDRGPDSKGVIDYLIELGNGGVKVEALRGNHEDMMLLAIHNPIDELDHWTLHGGRDTLNSYGLGDASWRDLSPDLLPPSHIDFLNGLKYYIKTKDFYLVHAGLDFNAADPLRDTRSMMYQRDTSVDELFLQHRRLVHGHTPSPLKRIESMIYEKLICIDGGCLYSMKSYLGNLVALDLETMELTVAGNIDN